MYDNRIDKIKSKYKGRTAKNYEEERTNTTHWQREQQVVGHFLDEAELEEGSLVLDVPTGTGRFFPHFKARRYKTIGVDASPDMLSEAKQKAKEIGYSDVDINTGDITDLQLADDSVDLSICIRLMNWLDYPGFQKAMSELRRVSSRFIIVGVLMSSDATDIGYSSWAKQLLKRWKSKLKTVARQPQHVLGQQMLDTIPSESSSGPSLINHSEDAVRAEFQRQGLAVAEEQQALSFRSPPRLANPGSVKEFPYHIFLLRV